ncbi:hypothetical protein DENSPDRAFT_519844 [Dentipellis sp. KUC8613]|nr:hypothetical protein DENSPDRAFT_519844 [Dentipellis sp. KUC8613]
MVPATMAAQVLVALQQNQFVTYFDVSASALLCYDYVLTLPDEVDLIWHSRWNAIKVAFLLSRYAAFWNLGVGIYHQFGRNIPISVCSGLYRANGGLIVSGIGLSEIIIIYRTYALWGKKKLVGCTMVLLFVVAWAVLGVYLAQFLHSIEFIPIEIIPPELQGCFVTKIADTLYICWTIALSYETTVMGLTLIKVWQKFRHTSSPLLYLIFRDSTLSYITLLVSSIANVLVVLLGPPEHTFLLAGTQHALHVILSSRIVLNIRRTAVSGAVVGRDHEIIELREIRLDPCANPLY